MGGATGVTAGVGAEGVAMGVTEGVAEGADGTVLDGGELGTLAGRGCWFSCPKVVNRRCAAAVLPTALTEEESQKTSPMAWGRAKT